jgi:hypothetical protein
VTVRDLAAVGIGTVVPLKLSDLSGFSAACETAGHGFRAGGPNQSKAVALAT